MLKIYLKTSLRHLSRSRIYAIINIIGLATGITAMLLAILFWRDEESFDEFHNNYKNIYRITTTYNDAYSGQRVTIGGAGQVHGPAFKAGVPEVKSYTRVLGGEIYSNIIANGKTIKIQPLFVDSNFLQVFTFPMLRGSAVTSLKDVDAIVLTETAARKLFNTTDVLGKLVEVDADPSYVKLGKPLVVTGVVIDPPVNSSLQFDALYSNRFMRLSFEDDSWVTAYLSTFLVLEPGTDPKQVSKKFDKLFAIHAKKHVEDYNRQFNSDPQMSYGLQRVDEIHLNPLMAINSNAEAGVVNGSRTEYSIIFLVVSAFILMMAAINFINLNLAGAIKRSKEVCVRKIAGGSRSQVISQFLIEASLLCCIAFVVSVASIYLVLPLFNELTGKQLEFTEIFSASILWYFTLLLLLLIALTSLYPSIIISRFKPAEVLYNRMTQTGSASLRKMLVILQFTPAIFLMIATIVYYSQINYMRTKSLGYNPDMVIRTGIYGDRDYQSAITILKSELAKEPSIKMISFGSNGYKDRLEINGQGMQLFKKTADENYLPLLEISLAAGRNLVPSDAGVGMLVNESFVRAANLEYAVGARVKVKEHRDPEMRTIVGVVKDHHYASPREPILPMVMFMKKDHPDGDMWVKVKRERLQTAIHALQAAYRKAMPSALFEYGLMDEMNAKDFVKEGRWQKVVTIGTVLSFVICWLGLFGLAHLTVYQRVKEIGIRKVLGASVSQIVMLLTGGFVKLVLVSLVIASPLAWWAMSYWLRDYAYRVNIGPGIFIIAAMMAVSVTLVSVGYQSLKSALANPVDSLRSS
jgi:putative ABC transport system permease protein